VQLFYDAGVAVGVVLALAAAMMLLREVSSGVVFLVRASFCEMPPRRRLLNSYLRSTAALCLCTVTCARCVLLPRREVAYA